MQEYTRSLNGNSIPEAYRGKSVAYQGGSSVAEIVSLGHAESEKAIVRAFYGAFNIATNPTVRDAANEGKTLEEIATLIAAYQIADEVEKRGGNPEALEKARAATAERKAKASKMDAIAEAAANNPELAAQLAALGIA